MKAFSNWWPVPVLMAMVQAAIAQPHGLPVRQANTTLSLPQNPAVYGYALTNAYTGFNNLIGAAVPPGKRNGCLSSNGRGAS